MQKTVSEDRYKYIGGSDIPIIMGISHFKSRYDLLLEKAQLKDDDFDGNDYTEYGNIMEPKIRQYINTLYKRNFKEDKLIKDDIRCHFDGIDDDMILEIKTTSQIKENVKDYKVYLVQLLFYMMNSRKSKGMLVVYERPEDFDEKFDSSRLSIFLIHINEYVELCQEIERAVSQFRIDLQKLKENPFLTEADLINNDVVSLSNKVVELEVKLKSYDELKKQYEDFKSRLKVAMEENGVKTWETPNGTKITLVPDKEDEVIDEEYFDEDRFRLENWELCLQYENKLAEYKDTRRVIKKGKKGYVKITLGKEND